MPSQVGQTRGTVPALAPVPAQVPQGPSPASRSDTVTPSMASPNVSDVSVSMSAPRRGRAWVPVPPRLPNTPPSRSPSRPPVLFGWLPKRSPRSNPKPPWPPPCPGIRTPPPNSDRASSYSLRRFSSDRTLYASEISLNFSSEAVLPLLASGWCLRASFRYDFLISSAEASLLTPRTL